MMFTVEALLAQSTNQLQKAGSMSPSLDAGILLCHALGKPRCFLWTWPDKIVESADMAVFEVLFGVII